MRVRTSLFALFFIALSAVLVLGQEDPTPVLIETPTDSPTYTLVPSPTETPLPPTSTDTPSLPPAPTNTLLPTDIPASTETYTPLPSETFLATSTLILSQTPFATTTLTPTPLPLMLAWTPVFIDSFVTPDPAAWNFTGLGWGYAPQPDGSGRLSVFNSSAPAFYQGITAADVAVEATVDVQAGTAHLYVRSSGTFGYEARLTPTGEIILLRASAVMATAPLPNFAASVPHMLRLSVVGNRLWVEVDGGIGLVADDFAPLPPGQVGLSASFPSLAEGVTPVPPQHQVTFGAFTLYQPADQVTPTANATATTPTLAPTLAPTITAWLAPTTTPVFPPVQRPPRAEAPTFGAFSISDAIDIADGDVPALIAALSMSGTLTINLAPNGEYVLTAAPYDLFAPTGLPIIGAGSNITINGNGATIRATVSGFRILGVDQGVLTLNDVILRDATLYTNGGAAISNSGGIVTLNRVHMENNRVESATGFGQGTGGAIYTFFGYTTINDSAFINNYAIKYGGGHYNWDGVITITNSRFEGNQAGVYGGAAATRDERSGSGISGERNVYLNNTAAQGGGAIYVESGYFTESGSRIENNTAGIASGGILFSGASGDPLGGSAPTVQVIGSDMTGNSSPLIVSAVGGNGTFDFRRNWWGSPSGPLAGDLVGIGVNVANPVSIPIVSCVVSVADSDADCLPDAFELGIPGLSVSSTDSDNNGVPDSAEDFDLDSLTNRDEFVLDTHPIRADSDEDELNDGDEVNVYRTDPLAGDSDGDGLRDGFEVNNAQTDPKLSDSDGNGMLDRDEDPDGDGLTNGQEQRVETQPLNVDTDADGVPDGAEDFDGDGLTNLQELRLLGADGAPLYELGTPDTDGNGVLDGDEDADGDSLTNRAEFTASANPLNADSDADRLPDGFEVNRAQTNPTLSDTDGNGLGDDREDPDGDTLNHYQEYRLGTDPLVFTTLGAPSRLRSETVLLPTRVTADGTAAITIMTVVRDAQGHFLPGRMVTWMSSTPTLDFSAASAETDEAGVATVQVTSAAVTSGVVEIRVLDVVVGRPLVQFIGGDPAVRFTATSTTGIQAAQVVNATFEVVNEGVLPITDIEVVANLPFGLGVIETVTAEGSVELRGQGSNAATWNIPALGVGERRTFSLRYRAGATLGLNTTLPLMVQTSTIEDTNAANNRASFAARIVPNFSFPSSDQQPEKLSVVVSAEPATAAIGQTISLVVRVENLSNEPLFNLSGFAPLLGTQYPNVAFTWNTPAQPGYLAPAGSGDASWAIARLPYTIPENYPVGLNRLVAVQAIDDYPADGSAVVVRDSLTDAELGIRGPNLQTSLTADRGSVGDGETITFTLTVSNSSTATDTAVNLQVSGSFITGTQTLAPLPPGASTTYQFTRLVTLDDVPQITAQALLTGQGELESDILIQRTLNRTVRVVRPVVPNSANLAFAATPTLVFLPGRLTPLPLTVVNNGEQNADAVRLRLSVPFGLEPDPATLGSGVYAAAARVITWELGTLAVGARQTFTPTFLTPADAILGTTFLLDATLATSSDEITLEDNVLSLAGVVALPAPARVTARPSPRNWLVGDDRDQLTLTVAVFDQLGAPLPGVTPLLTSSLPGIRFGIVDPTDAAGSTTTTVQATLVGAVTVTATFPNGVSGSITLNGRASAVEITRGPAAIGIGGTDQYNLFVVNTATLPDGITATGDLVDLTFTLPPELPTEWFTFAQPTLPLGFGDFTETSFTVSIPPASALPDCQAVVGTYNFTVTATGRTLGVVGQVQGTLNIVAQPPELTNIVPDNGGRVGGDRVLFRWRSNTPGSSTVYYRRQGETSYTALTLSADPLDPRLYSASVEVSADAVGTVFEWYGIIDNGCSTRAIGSAAAPQTFTRVRSTTLMDASYDFTVADDYDQMQTVDGSAMSIQVRNDDTVARAILLDVENPYDDLILGFTGSGSVDQVLLLQPGQSFSAPLRVFTQETQREVYTLAIRLENDRGDIDRIPLILRVQQPRLDLDIQVLSVDPRTLVTTARLTNRGDTLTDLALDIVQDSTGIPANFVIQPDIQHTYLLAGQSLEIAFIPLDLMDAQSGAGNMSMARFDPLTSTPLSSTPSLAAIPGPYRVTASARRIAIPNVTLRDGTLTNTCGADGSERTIAAECTTPAGSETRLINDWYCTNRPNIDIPVSLALPNGGLSVPITNITVGANFSPGSGVVYSHSTTVSLNGSLVGSAIVPSVSRIENSIPPQSLILGGSSPTQLLSLRSTHTNGTHYTVASGFTVTVDYDEHTRTGCFTQAEIDAAAGGTLMCTPTLPAIALAPNLRLDLSLADGIDPNTLSVGDRIPVVARITNAGTVDTTSPVILKLNIPEGLAPVEITVNADSLDIFQLVRNLVSFISNLFGGGDNTLTLARAGDAVDIGYSYTLEPLRAGGSQQFAFELEVLAEFAGTFTIEGTASTELPSDDELEPVSQSFASVVSANISEAQASLMLQVSSNQGIQVSIQSIDPNDVETDDPNDGRIAAIDLARAVLRGEQVLIRTQLENTSGADLNNIRTQITLSNDVAFLVATGDGQYDPSSATWLLSSLPALQTATLEIIVTVRSNVDLLDSNNRTRLLENRAQILSFEPSTVSALQPNGSAYLIPVQCEGIITSGEIVNTRAVPGIHPDQTVGNALLPNTEVGIINFTLTSDTIPAPINGTPQPYFYGWFRITDNLFFNNASTRFVIAARVSGCDDLIRPYAIPPVIYSGDLNQELPVPPSSATVETVDCNRSKDSLARLYCSAQVYIAFRDRFRAQFNRELTVRDVINIFLAGELYPDPDVIGASADLLAATAANVYHGFCVDSSQHQDGCDFYDILELLAGSDAWIQIGGTRQVNEERLTSLFDRFTSDLVQDNLPQGDALESLATWTGTLPNGLTATVNPIAWGNYYFGTDGYNQFVNGNDTKPLTEIYLTKVGGWGGRACSAGAGHHRLNAGVP